MAKLARPGFTVTRLPNSLADVTDDSGRSVRYRLEEMMQELCLGLEEYVGQSPLAGAGIFRGLPRAWVTRYFVHCLHQAMYPAARDMLVLAALREKERQGGWLFLRANPLFKTLAAVGMPSPGDLRVYGRKAHAVACLGSCAAAFAGTIGVACWHAAHSLLLRGERPQRRSASPVVLSQYCWGHLAHQKNNISFLEGGHVAPENVVLYFVRPDFPLTPEIERDARRLGLGGVLRPRRLTSAHGLKRFLRRLRPPQKRTDDALRRYDWEAPPSVALDIIGGGAQLLPAGVASGGRPRWDIGSQLLLLSSAFYFMYTFSYWRSFFLATNAAIHINYSGDCGDIHTIQTLAMESCGGVNIRSNYSYISIHDINFSREFHMYFVWGPQPRCSMEMEHFYCQAIFQIGYIFDYILEPLKAHPQDASADSLTIVLYDEAIDASTCHSHAVVNAFYQTFFDLLNENERLRLCIKSKALGSAELAALFPGFAAAEATGRVTVFPPKVLPCQAAAAADIAACSGLNTAGIEAALLGKPVVFLMHDKARCPQLERLHGGKAVYHGAEALKKDLREILAGRGWPPGFGDLTPVLDAIDPYRDGRSGARMGFVLARYLDEKRRGTPHREALRRCAEAFELAFGRHVALPDSPGLYGPPVHA
ncbi:hypothetical protein [Solidesulfovibrio sp.]|uniref:hypothetical protein n=1 Tax=Solidesulfovibrio sp. TaxID=2910990 RepID=UPI002B220794|nr:hypothetical protein [Solidesulfovibrio sp.]MEA5090924.1 hypothetical protein [Solidesulfovibrio sp.]